MRPSNPSSSPDLLPVVILCGGLGTRLRSVVADRPKTLAPVGDTPFLACLLDHVARQGFTDVILSTGYLGDMVQDFAGTGERWGVRVRYAEEPEPLGTGGALRYTADSAGLTSPFLVLNGDTFFSGSLADLVRFHGAHEHPAASIALVRVPHADRYGTVRAEPDTDAVVEFVEKGADAGGPAWINAGAYVIEPDLLDHIAPGTSVSLERDIFPQWIGKGLYGKRFPEALFLDIGTPEDYARAPDVLRRST